MPSTVLVTGGAGFIGRAVAPLLLDRRNRVVAVDSLLEQVHPGRVVPVDVDPRVDLRVADVTEAATWDALLADVRPDAVLHLAAETGTAQSLTEASRHASANVLGTTQMLDAFSRHGVRPDRVVLASSRAVYGEGAWRDAEGTLRLPGQRSHAMLAAAEWDFPGLTPLPTDAALVEPRPSSVYATTKLAQEQLISVWGLAVGVTTLVARLQNVYGPGQPPTNPYTGILPLFATLAAEGRPIPVYEDGAIVRDFVHVDDAARALVALLTTHDPPRRTIDIGSGRPTTLLDVAGRMAARYGAPPPEVTGQFRDGDVRYACADASAARELLGWEPTVDLDGGLDGLCAWLDETRDS